mmetsp:Transcript_27234/g.42394  ORF Transcript_27234/g.42394 Transcript_27234/m.42394 type:complete len:91 (-) Transcript_27234:362-634(-)
MRIALHDSIVAQRNWDDKHSLVFVQDPLHHPLEHPDLGLLNLPRSAATSFNETLNRMSPHEKTADVLLEENFSKFVGFVFKRARKEESTT